MIVWPFDTSQSDSFLSSIGQVCLVVEDLDAAVETLSGKLGIGPFKCWVQQPPSLFKTRFRGEPADWTMKLGLAMIADFQLEVIQPLRSPSLYSETLDAWGNSAHHLLLEAGWSSYEDVIEHFESRGMPVGQSARINLPVEIGAISLPALPFSLAEELSTEFAYIESQERLGTYLETARLPLGISLPLSFSLPVSVRLAKPDYVVPADNKDVMSMLPNHFIDEVVSVNFVTEDLGARVSAWTDDLKVAPWRDFQLDSDSLSEASYRGQPASYEARGARALVDKLVLEMVQPLSGESHLQEALVTQGGGIHSLSIASRTLGFDAAKEHMLSQGFDLISEGTISGAFPFAYFDTRNQVGTNLQLVTRSSFDRK